MSLKIDPYTASKKINEYLKEVDDLLKESYVEGYSKKSDLKSKIKAFITTTFEDNVTKLRNFSPQTINIFTVGGSGGSDAVDQKELQKKYISDLYRIKRHLTGYNEEISLNLDSQNNSIKNSNIRTITNEKESYGDNSVGYPQEILYDLKILIDSCNDDIGEDARVTYKLHVKEYNEILLKLNNQGYFKDFKPIKVELDAKHMTPLPPFEQAKLKEIIINSKKLQMRLQKMSPNFNEKNNKSSNIFISHGKPSEALKLLIKFIDAIGLNPVVVIDQPNQGMSIDDKVKTQIKRCEAVIILATGDDKVDSSLQPRQNVIHEIGYAEKDLDNRIIYLLEENTILPSNIPQAYTRFTKNNLTNAFIAIALDLKSFGIL
jgi:predicted nucleotide-binding protein